MGARRERSSSRPSSRSTMLASKSYPVSSTCRASPFFLPLLASSSPSLVVCSPQHRCVPLRLDLTPSTPTPPLPSSSSSSAFRPPSLHLTSRRRYLVKGGCISSTTVLTRCANSLPRIAPLPFLPLPPRQRPATRAVTEFLGTAEHAPSESPPPTPLARSLARRRTPLPPFALRATTQLAWFHQMQARATPPSRRSSASARRGRRRLPGLLQGSQ